MQLWFGSGFERHILTYTELLCHKSPCRLENLFLFSQDEKCLFTAVINEARGGASR